MLNRLLLILGLAGALTAAVAQADEHETTDPASSEYSSTESAASGYAASEPVVDDRWYLAPFGTYLNRGGDANAVNNGWGAGLGIGKMINEYFNVEVRGFWQHYGNRGLPGNFEQGDFRGNTDLAGGTIDLQYYFMRDVFSPYAVVGVGGMNSSMRFGNGGAYNMTRPSFIFETGVGATYELTDNFLLRGDVRYRLDTFPSNADLPSPGVFNDLVVNLGFVVPLGDKPQPIAAAPAPKADDCSTRDSDGDGVNDCDDKCPGTPPGTKVDDQGCPIRIELRGVNFMFDSAELTENAKEILDGVAEQLISMPTERDIQVAGHASSEGDRGHNLRLSQRRSDSVARYLKAKGVPNNLYPKGFGIDYPIADNSTEAGRIKNRRVELVWMGD